MFYCNTTCGTGCFFIVGLHVTSKATFFYAYATNWTLNQGKIVHTFHVCFKMVD